MNRTLGWGLIGASTIARQHMLGAINADERSAVNAVMSSSRERAQAFAREHGVASAHDSLAALLADPGVDAVYISTTNERHHDQVLTAAAAGKHVLCEKPLAVTVADAVAMRAACEAAGVVMGTNHHLRHAATIRAMRRLVADGSIGVPLAARVFHARLLPVDLQTWRVHSSHAGGGVVLDVTVHDTDTLRFLLDDEVVQVSALGATQGPASEDITDAVMGVMRFAGGTLASFHDAFTVPHAGTGLELHGTEGSLIGRDVMTQMPIGEVFRRHGDALQPVDVGPREDLYARAARVFNDAVLTGSAPQASAADGVRSLAVAVAVAQAAASGRAVRVADPLDGAV